MEVVPYVWYLIVYPILRGQIIECYCKWTEEIHVPCLFLSHLNAHTKANSRKVHRVPESNSQCASVS
jgi:hypothetical protein